MSTLLELEQEQHKQQQQQQSIDSLSNHPTTTQTTRTNNVTFHLRMPAANSVPTGNNNGTNTITSNGNSTTIGTNHDNSNNNDNVHQHHRHQQHFEQRLVVVRYYLDRPGYGLHNSVARHWFNPPSICTTVDIIQFLKTEQILMDDILIEIFMDIYGSYMVIDSIRDYVHWNFEQTTISNPGFIILRFTDLSSSNSSNSSIGQEINTTKQMLTKSHVQKVDATMKVEYANTIPVGLLSFSVMVGLESASLFKQLGSTVDGQQIIQNSYDVSWGPLVMFVGGVLQLFTAYFQVLRNNIYGTVAFFGFGAFWFSYGLKLILLTFTTCGLDAIVLDDSSSISALTQPDDIGRIVPLVFTFSFTLVLLKQTFTMSKLSTLLMTLLALKIGVQIFTPWGQEPLLWLQFIFGSLTSIVAFYLFTVDFTNQVYHRDVFKTYKWSEEHSPEEVFGAPGKSNNTLLSKATQLRRGHSSYHDDLTNVNINADGTTTRTAIPTTPTRSPPSPSSPLQSSTTTNNNNNNNS